MSKSLSPMSLVAAVREARAAGTGRRAIVVDGARALAPLLARDLREGGDPSDRKSVV